MVIVKQLTGNDSEESAYVVDDYPYGFRLRTTIRYWVETAKNKDQRFCSQTKNPKTGQWNKPKKGTYSSVIVMGLDENNHVTHTGYHMGTYEDEVDQFIAKYQLSEVQKKSMDIARAYARAQKMVTWTVTSRPYNPNEENKEPVQTMKDQCDIMKKCAVIAYAGMKKNGELSTESVI
ncbi:MAG: hypothetical protein PHC39_04635 [Proteiniphilum sp.]|nr:hypothetical protein [Proteiniphilum sp.]